MLPYNLSSCFRLQYLLYMLEPNFQEETVINRASDKQKVKKQFGGGFRKPQTKQYMELPSTQQHGISLPNKQSQKQINLAFDANIKTQYGGGFRKFQPKIQKEKDLKNLSSTVKQSKVSSSSALLYVEQLGIQNLPQLYLETTDNTKKLNQQRFQQFRQQQAESMVRLYKNLYPTRSKNQQQSEKNDTNKQNKKYAEDIWKQDKKYDTEPNKFIVKKQLQKLHKRFQVQLQGVCKRKKIQPYANFKILLICFLLQQYENILKNQSNTFNSESQIEIDQMNLFYLWKGFVSTINIKNAESTFSKMSISKQNLYKLKRKSKYLYCLIASFDDSLNNFFTFNDLKNLIKDNLQIPIQQLLFQFKPNNQYTNPLCLDNVKNNQKKSKRKLIFQTSQKQEEIKKIKAKPVPKSTYEQPIVKQRVVPKKTEVQPFEIKEKSPIKTFEQYYNYQRQFKAQPVPVSTYKPHKIQLLSEEEIKARATMMLSKSKYPDTMRQNLENYKDQKRNKIDSLKKKYQKFREAPKPRQVPDFDQLHEQQLMKKEIIKRKNQKQTVSQPFSLSKNKLNRTKTIEVLPKQQPSYKYVHVNKSPKNRPKTTMKFDAYLNFRKKNMNEKQMKEKQKQKEDQERNNRQKSRYQNARKSYDPQNQASSPKRQGHIEKQFKLNWKPIFL